MAKLQSQGSKGVLGPGFVTYALASPFYGCFCVRFSEKVSSFHQSKGVLLENHFSGLGCFPLYARLVCRLVFTFQRTQRARCPSLLLPQNFSAQSARTHDYLGKLVLEATKQPSGASY